MLGARTFLMKKVRNIGKIGATRYQILRLKCTKFDFRWGSIRDPDGGAYSTLPCPVVVFKGLLLMGGRRREGEGTGMRRKGKMEGRGGGREGP